MIERQYMEMAIELAKKGEGWTNPNPMVGAVIVKNGRLIGKGYHAKAGQLHAERNAIASLIESAEGATMYVTLEPCCHYGKTPPCTEAILDAGIARVVIGSRDPNPMVAGKGVRLLKEAGVIVEEDFMREECDEINSVFFHYISSKTPYLVMKYAMTADGKTAVKSGASKWISCEESREEVHRMRGRYMGIMVGVGTVLADNPMLNTRLEGLRSPIRIVCDSRLRIPLESQICKTAREYQTIVVCAEKEPSKLLQLEKMGVRVIEMAGSNGQVDLRKLMQKLGSMNIDSVLLEGGGTLADSALRAGIVKELKAFVAPKIFGGAGSRSPVEGAGAEKVEDAIMLECQGIRHIGQDLLVSYKIKGGDRCLQE